MNEFQQYYQQRDVAARAWKSKGGRVVGYFCDSVPDEIILAAGFFPYRISGDPTTQPTRANQYEQTFGFEAFAKSVLHLLISGRYDFLDYLVIPHSRASIHQLYPLLTGIKQKDPSLAFPLPYFIDMAHTTFLTSALYNRDRLIEFKAALEKWSGKSICNESLTKAIAVGNENKRLLNEIERWRMDSSSRLTGTEVLQIIGTSMWILKEEHNTLLRDLLTRVLDRPPHSGVRVFVQSSPIDDLQLYQLIESCGAIVVDEGHCWGSRNAQLPVDTSGDPLEAIIDRYQFKPPCSRTFPMTRRTENLIAQVEESKARGVIFYIHANDAQAWEVYHQTLALKEKGIPSLYLKQQPYGIADTVEITHELQNFIQSL